jgi:hypothetical protein
VFVSDLKCRFLSLLAVGVFCLGVDHAQAGTLTKVGSEACDYLFSGPIETGDAAQFENIGRTYSGEKICFDSEGGSLLEGQRIFDRIWEYQLVTRVEAGQKCLSACAIAFLGGSLTQGTAVIHFMDRKISPGARLGFHAPSLGLDTQNSYNSAQVNKAFEIALSAAEGLFRIKAIELHSVKPMSDFLYYQILRTRPDDMYYIDTVGRAVMANIPLQNISYPTRISERMIENICDSAYLYHIKGLDPALPSIEAHYQQARKGVYGGTRVMLQREGDMYRGVVRDYPTAAKFYEHVCMVEIDSRNMKATYDFPEDKFWVSFGHLQTVDSVTKYASVNWSQEFEQTSRKVTLPAWYMLDPEASIASLGQGGAQPRAAEVNDTSRGQCVVFSGGRMVDSEPCQRIKSAFEGDASHVVSTFIWPSGSKTVAEAITRRGIHKINGAETAIQRVAVNDTTHPFHASFIGEMRRSSAQSFEADCWTNPSSSNTFCFQLMR